MIHWYLGTIGYSYKEWVGGFYPPGTIPREYISFYSKVFNTVEIDTSFHSTPRLASIQAWQALVPQNFIFCFKTPKVITHEMQLVNVEGLMTEFLNAIQPLKGSLGPVLIQLPPSFRLDRIRALHDFFQTLPLEFTYAIELRHSSWYTEQTTDLLSQFGICWVAIDFPKIPRQIIKTANFYYVRWIGVNGMYQHHSFERVTKNDQLRWWLNAIQNTVPDNSLLYGYFNNDYTGFAAGTCKRFLSMAGYSDLENNLPYQDRLF